MSEHNGWGIHDQRAMLFPVKTFLRCKSWGKKDLGKGPFLLFIFACSSFKLSIIHFDVHILNSYATENNSISPLQSTKCSFLDLSTSYISLWPLQCQIWSSLQYPNASNTIYSLFREYLLGNNVNQDNFSSCFKELLIGCFQSAVSHRVTSGFLQFLWWNGTMPFSSQRACLMDHTNLKEGLWNSNILVSLHSIMTVIFLKRSAH